MRTADCDVVRPSLSAFIAIPSAGTSPVPTASRDADSVPHPFRMGHPDLKSEIADLRSAAHGHAEARAGYVPRTEEPATALKRLSQTICPRARILPLALLTEQ